MSRACRCALAVAVALAVAGCSSAPSATTSGVDLARPGPHAVGVTTLDLGRRALRGAAGHGLLPGGRGRGRRTRPVQLPAGRSPALGAGGHRPRQVQPHHHRRRPCRRARLATGPVPYRALQPRSRRLAAVLLQPAHRYRVVGIRRRLGRLPRTGPAGRGHPRHRDRHHGAGPADHALLAHGHGVGLGASILTSPRRGQPPEGGSRRPLGRRSNGVRRLGRHPGRRGGGMGPGRALGPAVAQAGHDHRRAARHRSESGHAHP